MDDMRRDLFGDDPESRREQEPRKTKPGEPKTFTGWLAKQEGEVQRSALGLEAWFETRAGKPIGDVVADAMRGKPKPLDQIRKLEDD